MSDCDRQKNNKKPIDDRSTITVTTGVMSFKPIGNGLVINYRNHHDCHNIFWSKAGRYEARQCIINIYVVGMIYVFIDMGNAIKALHDK